MEQEEPITVLHHFKTIVHEANRTISEVMAFPSTSRNLADAEQGICDLTVACLRKPTIQRAQSEDKPVPARA